MSPRVSSKWPRRQRRNIQQTVGTCLQRSETKYSNLIGRKRVPENRAKMTKVKIEELNKIEVIRSIILIWSIPIMDCFVQ